MAFPAILYFNVFAVFLFDDKVRIDLASRFKTFGLNDFEVDSNVLPLVCQQLIGLVFINQRQRREARENVLTNNGFLLWYAERQHVLNQLAFQVIGEISKSGDKAGFKLLYLRMAADRLCQVINLWSNIGRPVVRKEFGTKAGENLPIVI
ncbi:hypothetical protein [Pectobacterium polaris]|uniref:hypothetical protein n=1 Tax=Pectobacterium polaris TaxID=2042057 RepID=UPI001FAF9F2E|nr:hypothetical protein [Pectobacterium polaris]